jgi:glycosyltransferase involved in cell wall biosynthesis
VGDMLWIAWERHRRTTVLAKALCADLRIFCSSRSRLVRHPVFLWKTVRSLLRERPRILIVQSPSLLLLLIALLLKRPLGYRLAVDAHNAAVQACSRWEWALNPLYPFFHRGADLTIVSNPWHAEIIERHDGIAVVLPDRIPEFGTPLRPSRPSSDVRIVYIQGGGPDEPLHVVIGAARLLPAEFTIFVTGPCQRPELVTPQAGARVVFTGFLPDARYIQTLVEADVIVDLTTWQDCLVCGAYEAIAAGTPLILSDNRASKNYFDKGVVHIANRAEDLAVAIKDCVVASEVLRSELAKLRGDLDAKWRAQFDILRSRLSNLQ